MIQTPAASLFDRAGRPPQPRSLVRLRAAESGARPGRPLFCIHGMGGHLAIFFPLARQLPDARPVYGLQGLGLEPDQVPHETIEDMADFYTDEIRRTEPRGPYLLAGWSLGGTIAWEIARRLETAGLRVALVAMLDTYLTTADYERLELGDDAALKWIGSLLGLSAVELKKQSLARQWETIAAQARRVEGPGVAEIRRLADVCQAHLRAGEAYVPQPYAGRVVLFQAGGGREGLDPRWRALCPALDAEPVPGNHYSMLRKPDVDVLAERLGRYLGAADAAEAP